MLVLACLSRSMTVALLAEGVDRNAILFSALCSRSVALLAEGVDRNTSATTAVDVLTSRPPRGGRG